MRVRFLSLLRFGVIDILGRECFCGCESLESVSFEDDSHLVRIEEREFRNSSICHIVIPCRVEILCKECFHLCKSLESVSLEDDSHLVQIEERAFSGPRNISYRVEVGCPLRRMVYRSLLRSNFF